MLIGDSYVPITESMQSIVSDPNQLHRLVKLIDLNTLR